METMEIIKDNSWDRNNLSFEVDIPISSKNDTLLPSLVSLDSIPTGFKNG